MGDVKPWQIVLMVAAVVAVGVSAFLTLGRGDGVDVASRMYMVDVETGELFWFRVGGGKAVFPPELNPKTNNRSLVPVYKDKADGQWKVARSDRFMLEQVEGATNKVVDTSTLLVRVASQDATRVR